MTPKGVGETGEKGGKAKAQAPGRGAKGGREVCCEEGPVWARPPRREVPVLPSRDRLDLTSPSPAGMSRPSFWRMLFLPSSQPVGSYKQTFPKVVADLLLPWFLTVQPVTALSLTRKKKCVGRMEMLNCSETRPETAEK